MHTEPVIAQELEALLSAPRSRTVPQSQWVAALVANRGAELGDAELAELACERDPAGPAATICGLIDGLLMRHAADPTTVAALMAIRAFHLPDLP